MNLVLKNTNNKRNPHLKSQFPSDHISPHFFLRLKILTLFKFYLKFLVFEFHFFHACVNLDFYLIIYGLEFCSVLVRGSLEGDVFGLVTDSVLMTNSRNSNGLM